MGCMLLMRSLNDLNVLVVLIQFLPKVLEAGENAEAIDKLLMSKKEIVDILCSFLLLLWHSFTTSSAFDDDYYIKSTMQ